VARRTRHDTPALEGPPELLFRGLHRGVFLGTASDRYAGWIGLVYARGRWEEQLTRRSRSLGGRTFTEEVLPLDSVREYFEHFPVLELDFTFYRTLLNWDGSPTENLHLLSAYRERLGPGDRILLKAPQAVIAPRLRRGAGFVENREYLDPDVFTRRFHEPAVHILGEHLAGIIFEQEYERKQDREAPEAHAARLDAFFAAVSRDTRCHLELRTEAYLAEPVFAVMERHGVGQVLSHWTWLPHLEEQFERAGRRYLNPRDQVIRLMTPHGMRYEESYLKAHPFDRLVPGMMSERMVEETARLMREAVRRGVAITVIVNNRAGGSAPLIAREVADRFKVPVFPH
jgi:hypothetical protein